MSRLVLAAAVAAPALLGAQERPPLTFSAVTELVTVDVVVTDAKGVPVRGLTRDDFVIYEDGAAQPLSMFEPVDRPQLTTPESTEAAVPSSPAATVRDERPVVMVVFDEPHLSPDTLERSRRRLAELIAARGLAGTRVSLVSTNGGGAWQANLPEDAADLTAALARFRGGRVPQGQGRMKDYEAFQIATRRNNQVLIQVYRRYLDFQILSDKAMPMKSGTMRGQPEDRVENVPPIGRASVQAEAEELWGDIRRRQHATIDGLTRLVRGLIGSRNRKAVLFVTEGFIQDSTVPEHRELVEAARHARASVHLIDPRHFERGSSHSVENFEAVDTRDEPDLLMAESKGAEGAQSLAVATGGRIVRSLPGLGDELDRIGAGLRTFYLLGYAPAAAAPDGRFHKLAVELKQPGLRVSARPGYFALSPGARADKKAPVPQFQLALDSPVETQALRTHLAGFVLGPGQKGRTRVRLVAEVESGRADSASRGAEALEAAFQLTSRDRSEAQQWSTTAKWPRSGDRMVRFETEFEASPGAYQARLAVNERGGERLAGAATHAIEVPAEGTFRTSTPILTDLASDNRPVARADRRFLRTGRLMCLIEVMGVSGSRNVTAGVALRDASGQVKLRIPPAPFSSERMSRMWAIPLADLPPGPYELAISVQDSATRRDVGTRESFEVLANDD